MWVVISKIMKSKDEIVVKLMDNVYGSVEKWLCLR